MNRKKGKNHMSRQRFHNEVLCIVCDGAGTVNNVLSVYGVKLCRNCNGHGVLLKATTSDNKQVLIEYDKGGHTNTTERLNEL